MFDWFFAIAAFAIFIGIVLIIFLIHQWAYWMDTGGWWWIYEKGRYKDWYVAEWERGAISLFVAIIVASIAAGFIGGIQ